MKRTKIERALILLLLLMQWVTLFKALPIGWFIGMLIPLAVVTAEYLAEFDSLVGYNYTRRGHR